MIRVVAVDDDAVVLMALAMSAADVSLLEATRASDAFALAVLAAPDGIIIDRRLPDGDGVDLVRRFRCDVRTNRTPIVVLTASHDPLDEARVLMAGADAYMAKPFDPKVVYATIRAIASVPADQRRPRRQTAAARLRRGSAIEPIIDLRNDVDGDWRERALVSGQTRARRWWDRRDRAVM